MALFMTSVVYLNFSKSILASATVLSRISVKTISIHCSPIPGSTVSVGSLPAGMVTIVGRSSQTGSINGSAEDSGSKGSPEEGGGSSGTDDQGTGNEGDLVQSGDSNTDPTVTL